MQNINACQKKKKVCEYFQIGKLSPWVMVSGSVCQYACFVTIQILAGVCMCVHTSCYGRQITVKMISPVTALDTLNTINLHLRSQPALTALLAFYINIFTFFNHWGSSQSFSIADASLLFFISCPNLGSQ